MNTKIRSQSISINHMFRSEPELPILHANKLILELLQVLSVILSAKEELG